MRWCVFAAFGQNILKLLLRHASCLGYNTQRVNSQGRVRARRVLSIKQLSFCAAASDRMKSVISLSDRKLPHIPNNNEHHPTFPTSVLSSKELKHKHTEIRC